MTKYEEQYYHDINRIANALEKLVQNTTKQIVAQPLSKELAEELMEKTKREMMDGPSRLHTTGSPQYVCPHCYSTNIRSMYGIINLDGSNDRTHYICNECHKEFDVDKGNTNEMFINGQRLV